MFDLVKRNSFQENFNDRMFKGLDKIFDDFLNFEPINLTRNYSYFPEYKLTKTEKEHILSMELPGIKKENLKIDIEDNSITVSYRKNDKEDFYTKFSSFSKRIKVDTENVKIDDISAKLDAGILKISMPLKEGRNQHKEIKIEWI